MSTNRQEIVLKAVKFKTMAYNAASSDSERKRAIDKYNELVNKHTLTRAEILKMEKLRNSPSFEVFGKNFVSIAEFKAWFFKLPFREACWKGFKLVFKIEKFKQIEEIKK